MTKGIIQFYVMVFGNTLNSHTTFVNKLTHSWNFREVNSMDESDVIVAFVAIASRAGTDIEAALHKIPASRPVVLVVLHHTTDPNVLAPDSRLCVNRGNVFTVDCLFNEDRGLLTCQQNDKALEVVKKHLIEKHASFKESQPSNYHLDGHDESPVIEEPYSPAYHSRHAERHSTTFCPTQVQQFCRGYWFVFLIIGIVIIILIVLGSLLGRG
ncbi:uncharacterized protein [Salminus brasiliensis]|uniref:uncharacterized protein n=1 Tax=Salminus brasiliensis TaxID=930266 RepID=UPI003B82DE52